MKAYKNSVIQCPTHTTIIGQFLRDCDDIHHIPKSDFSEKIPIIGIDANPNNNFEYSCPKCGTQLMVLRGDYWDIVGKVRLI